MCDVGGGLVSVFNMAVEGALSGPGLSSALRDETKLFSCFEAAARGLNEAGSAPKPGGDRI